MNAGLTIDTEVIDGDILTVKLRGSLDSLGSPEFERAVGEHIANGHSRIIVDCRYLHHLSSLGIGTLVALQTRVNRRGGSVKLSTLSGPAAQLIKAVRLDKILGIYGDLEFARQSFFDEAADAD
jgi:anti-anti-sigma factor